MTTLLLQCVAPLQAWGTQSEYIVRDTGRDPSKSGVVGLLCAALGRPRTESVEDLATLKMGVRVDQEGKILRDYHTITDKTRKKPSTVVSTRYYLADAMFLVGLESENRAWLEQLHGALHRPKWSLFLGRKSCPPSRPPFLPHGLIEKPLHDALECYPWLGQNKRLYEQETVQRLRIVYDDPNDGREFRHDHPVSFERNNRHFHPRRVTTGFLKKRPPFDPTYSYPMLKEVAL